MDIHTKLVLIRNSKTGAMEDKTAEIRHLQFNANEVAVTFERTNKTYTYKTANVQVFERPQLVALDNILVYVDNYPVSDCSKALDFGDYIKVVDSQGRTITYPKSKVAFHASCLNSKNSKAIFEYFKRLSAYVSVMDDGKTLLLDQYEKLDKVSEQSVLATYLSASPIEQRKNDKTTIFPFGFNLSQREAVKYALENTISIIEGPPGTGKTQTILNIIANIVSRGKTVAVVSGNNSATSNVQEKLEKHGYSFFTALLGNASIKKDFFEHKQVEVPDLSSWVQEHEQLKLWSERLMKIDAELTELLQDRNQLARLQDELSKFLVEQAHFEHDFKGEPMALSKFSLYKRWSNDSILSFIQEYERYIEGGREGQLVSKAYMLFKYGIHKHRFLREHQEGVVSSLNKTYYVNRIQATQEAISTLKARLDRRSYEALMEEYTELSAKLFRARLYDSFATRARGHYTARNFKHKFQEFLEDYPVVLSTTHSLRTSMDSNYMFDYVIMDEASQVDLVTASLVLSSCRNVVIVGDVKQLPHIVPSEMAMKSDVLFRQAPIAEAYDYSKFSIISSFMHLYGDRLPKTLLCEHYRCHPKIIGFCNEKFYEGQLVVMTEEKPTDRPLRLYRTAPGNHARKDQLSDQKGWYNIRQIEVVRDEIVDSRDCGDYTQVGIISPYRKHVTETVRLIGHPELEVDTVHKFQGREKHTIIFTTVANEITPFVDDANLINVAVSRAVQELVVVTSHKLFRQHGTHIGDLIRYIEYNSLDEAIVESQKISVFDLLYSESSEKLLKVMQSSKHVSKYKSENLMYGVIEEALRELRFHSFKCVLHVPLNTIVRDYTHLNAEEKAYARNPWTHVDFLIFNKLDKEPVLAIEVDGHAYHRNNSRQRQRDAMKDNILAQIDLPLLRIATNESGEKQKLMDQLERIIRKSAEQNA